MFQQLRVVLVDKFGVDSGWCCFCLAGRFPKKARLKRGRHACSHLVRRRCHRFEITAEDAHPNSTSFTLQNLTRDVFRTGRFGRPCALRQNFRRGRRPGPHPDAMRRRGTDRWSRS